MLSTIRVRYEIYVSNFDDQDAFSFGSTTNTSIYASTLQPTTGHLDQDIAIETNAAFHTANHHDCALELTLLREVRNIVGQNTSTEQRWIDSRIFSSNQIISKHFDISLPSAICRGFMSKWLNCYAHLCILGSTILHTTSYYCIHTLRPGRAPGSPLQLLPILRQHIHKEF